MNHGTSERFQHACASVADESADPEFVRWACLRLLHGEPSTQFDVEYGEPMLQWFPTEAQTLPNETDPAVIVWRRLTGCTDQLRYPFSTALAALVDDLEAQPTAYTNADLRQAALMLLEAVVDYTRRHEFTYGYSRVVTQAQVPANDVYWRARPHTPAVAQRPAT